MLIQPYNPNWAINFEKIKEILDASVFNYILDIQHVGSTAVPNLAAKPIIDIDIIYGEDDDFDTIKPHWKNWDITTTEIRALKDVRFLKGLENK